MYMGRICMAWYVPRVLTLATQDTQAARTAMCEGWHKSTGVCKARYTPLPHHPTLYVAGQIKIEGEEFCKAVGSERLQDRVLRVSEAQLRREEADMCLGCIQVDITGIEVTKQVALRERAERGWRPRQCQRMQGG